jgi:hypothetical protein
MGFKSGEGAGHAALFTLFHPLCQTHAAERIKKKKWLGIVMHNA